MNDNTVKPDGVNKIVEETKAKVADLNLQSAASSTAASDPFPGPMAEVMEGGFAKVKTSRGDLEFRPIVASDLVVLRKLNSPIYRELLEMGTPEVARTKVEYVDEDIFDIVYQFTNPIKDVRVLLKRGIDAYHEVVMDSIGDKYSLSDLPALVSGFQTIILGSTSTMVEHEVPETKEMDDKGKMVGPSDTKQTDFFVNATGSAGGLSTSVA